MALSKLYNQLVALAVLGFFALVAGPINPARTDDDSDVRIMTQNIYQGTSFTEILSATTLPAFLGAVTLTRQNILATKPVVRAAAIAGNIVRESPDLVALQEVAILRAGLVPVSSPPAPPIPVTMVEMDQLALILDELDRRGHRYEPVAILPNIDAQAPSSLGTSVRVTARTVILARSGHHADEIQLSNMQIQEYLALLATPTPAGVAIPNTRGWAAIDVRVRGRSFRFVTTHLEQFQPYNFLQATEALQSAINATKLPVVFVGDFNIKADVVSDPTYSTYQALLAAGLVDAWKLKHSSDPGPTCCQLPSVTNVTTNLSDRVDLVMLRGGIGVRDIHLVGEKTADRVGGVWPSDHAGIVATLRISGTRH